MQQAGGGEDAEKSAMWKDKNIDCMEQCTASCGL